MCNSSPVLVMELGCGLLSENGPTSQLTHEPQSGYQESFTLTFSGSPPGSYVHGILQARIVEWIAIPFSRGSSLPMN